MVLLGSESSLSALSLRVPALRSNNQVLKSGKATRLSLFLLTSGDERRT